MLRIFTTTSGCGETCPGALCYQWRILYTNGRRGLEEALTAVALNWSLFYWNIDSGESDGLVKIVIKVHDVNSTIWTVYSWANQLQNAQRKNVEWCERTGSCLVQVSRQNTKRKFEQYERTGSCLVQVSRQNTKRKFEQNPLLYLYPANTAYYYTMPILHIYPANTTYIPC